MTIRGENALTCLLYSKLKMSPVKEEPLMEQQGYVEGSTLC